MHQSEYYFVSSLSLFSVLYTLPSLARCPVLFVIYACGEKTLFSSFSLSKSFYFIFSDPVKSVIIFLKEQDF